MTLDEMYAQVCSAPSEINIHCPLLRELAAQCDELVEFGYGNGASTVALLAGQPKKLTSYDVAEKPNAVALAAVAGRTEFRFVLQSDLDAPPVSAEMLFIDTIHTGRQLYAELTRHAAGVRRLIVMHDTEYFAYWDETMQEPGLWPALWRFLKDHPEWRVSYVSQKSYGLTVLERWK